ncbi:hypothetical protein ACN082_09905 [Rothia sp. CCM 9417]|uniref:hypothetical protein n=1 Tax=Rothia sp. CCM 9417 TaxID=3402657 RepID=UPI003AD8B6F6
MNKQETHVFLTAVNQNDPRVEPSSYAVSVWQEQLEKLTPAQADAAYRAFVRRSDDKPTARQIRLLAQSLIESARAQASARQITHDTTKITFAQWKVKYPGRAEQCWRDGVASVRGSDVAACLPAPQWAVGAGSVVASVGGRL